MSTVLRATENDTFDLLCLRHYGRTSGGVVEAVMMANPALRALPPVLPSGTLVTMPDIAVTSPTAAAPLQKLWD